MKECVHCKQAKPLSEFHADKRHADGHHPYCKSCRREIYGHKERRSRIEQSCAYCGERFYPRLSQTDSNKSGVFFCKREHQHAFNTTNAVSPYYGYRVYILVRDQAKCFLCHGSGKLHVHHIQRRGLGGTDDYRNLIVLCAGCHLGKAHGIEAQKFKSIFFEYTAQFTAPEFWPQVMERSAHDRRKIAALKRKTSKSRYQKIKESDRFKRYQEKQRQWRKKRNQQHREKYGCSYVTYRKRLILEQRKNKLIA